ncbi:tumor necrosis factor ligand superfamily member 14 [Archocentrus centrarchus]|uniref:tumor necrosis factor ligand superfamily member 14 n=1 Tax=Archocentrus centrarchus TaxID=63155 RepID=UPI0011E9E086|nr:tumor necrosis factor ligand superfamily member 14-like [Archocentrus centrarchus]XP_030591108.1 tumor necrosis factor ligand superfamily member 14-like [Archocentrus centrarchus]XP_030591109.1 tumor necrosis factor ligand superfamily member 14-like [Archocentrus centrarchus]XP_030591110.1 tumor necrosis factor ligand superfamily member 14-like [Archocentrus centrarchus]XP_030591111.1 tumor necrosis factor ligand superfamily member 14-like [Archocentrus centrarchus]
MEKVNYPSVCVVDTHATRPPVPPRLNQMQRKSGVAQILLFMLVSLALCGMVIEACFIYGLYHPVGHPTTSASSSKQSSDDSVAAPAKHGIPPSKPVAHLTDGQDVAHEKHKMAWSMNADPLLYEMTYEDKKLIIQKEGYYYVYSKVFFSDNDIFRHHINWHTNKYDGNITLLQSRKFSLHSNKKQESNSYLGGVFHFYEGDGISVQVSDTSKIVRHKPFENIFGAYMI